MVDAYERNAKQRRDTATDYISFSDECQYKTRQSFGCGLERGGEKFSYLRIKRLAPVLIELTLAQVYCAGFESLCCAVGLDKDGISVFLGNHAFGETSH